AAAAVEAEASTAAPVSASVAPTEAADAESKKRAIIRAALERARKKKEELAAKGQGPLNTEHVSADVQAQIDAAESRRRRLGLADDSTDPDTPPSPAGARNPR
ncbi:MAG TPA: electron transport complex subunit RsxB, partial [Paraburkholderia sp.]